MRTKLGYIFMLILSLLIAGCSTGGGMNANSSGSGGATSGGSGGTGSGGSGTGSGGGNTSACSSISLGQGASLNGFLTLPADKARNQDISAASVYPKYAANINLIGP